MSHSKPLVSVIIPVYNTEKYLRDCLDCVINQTLREIEIICVDDGSTDNSLEILREYENRDDRIRVLTQKNQFAGVARNHGMEVARGAYFAFLDSDDFFEPEMLEKMYWQIREYDADICLCGRDKYDTNTGKYSDNSNALNIKSIKKQPFCFSNQTDIFQVADPTPGDKLFSAEFIRRHSIQFPGTPRTEDVFFVSCALALAEKIVYVDEVFYHYRIGQTMNLQSGVYKTPELCCEITLDVKRRLKDEACWNFVKDSFVNRTIGRINYSLDCLEKHPEAVNKLLGAIDRTYFRELGIEGFPESKIVNKKAYNRLVQALNDYRVPKYVKTAGRYTEEADWKPAVSVIIPVYNVEKYLRECLDSIINQTLRDIEIICINDGSTDGSLSILEEYQKNDRRITVVSQSNGGQSAARNSGMKRARGDYIHFMDSDDYLETAALETLLRLAREKKTDALFFGFKRIYESEDLRLVMPRLDEDCDLVVCKEIHTGVEYLRESIRRKKYVVSPCLALWSSSFLRDNHIWFKEGIIHENNLFLFQAMMAAARVLDLPNQLYHRRVREDSTMTKPKSAKNVTGYFGCAMGVLDYGLALRDDDNPEKKRETVQEFRRMVSATKRDYNSIASEERAKVSFSTELEKELFEQIVVSGQELSHTKNELNRIKQELSHTKSELSRTKDELNGTRSNLSRTKYDLDCVRASVSFRIGRAITWLPRKVRGVSFCLRDNGVKYTIHRIGEKLRDK